MDWNDLRVRKSLLAEFLIIGRTIPLICRENYKYHQLMVWFLGWDYLFYDQWQLRGVFKKTCLKAITIFAKIKLWAGGPKWHTSAFIQNPFYKGKKCIFFKQDYVDHWSVSRDQETDGENISSYIFHPVNMFCSLWS